MCRKGNGQLGAHDRGPAPAGLQLEFREADLCLAAAAANDRLREDPIIGLAPPRDFPLGNSLEEAQPVESPHAFNFQEGARDARFDSLPLTERPVLPEDDALYVALATVRDCQLVTADSPLHRGLKNTALRHRILWIEDVPTKD